MASLKLARNQDKLWRAQRTCVRLLLRFIGIWLSFFLGIIVFRVMNRLTMRGRRRRIGRGPLLVVTNHQSMIDSFLLGQALFFPELLLRWWDPPFHLADADNFGKHPILGPIFDALRAIPINRKKRDMAAFIAAVRALRNGHVLCLFPEGGRGLPGETLRPFMPLALAYAIAAETPIYLCAFQGMHDVQTYLKSPLGDPVGWRKFLRHTYWLTSFRFGKRVTFSYGPYLSVEDVRAITGDGTSEERAARLGRYVETQLRSLKEETERHHCEGAP